MLLPLLVLFIVVGGFYRWRAICPLAAFGEIGRLLPRRFQRRVPEWLERGHMVVPFVLLGAMLVLRHVATNGDGRWIGGLLIGLAIAAIATNAIFTGKTWCNFFCPVGVVERIYTDPSSLLPAANSQCARCTACKRSCPDIDQENNYWRELTGRGRRFATYAFPGLVLAFYLYFWLRVGDWEAYFDGRWTRQTADAGLAFGPGFFFAPGVPAIAAAALTLAVCALVSYGLFRALEAGTRRLLPGYDRRRHQVLSLAAFTAFSVFYFYAGAPTLRRITGATRAFAFAAPAIGMVVLVRRWGRRRETYVRERGAARLLKNWPFEGTPPSDPVEAYARAQASEHARDQLLAGYLQTLRDVVADGLVDESEVRTLAEIRKQFGITPREHDRAIARLPADERALLVSGRFVTVEERLQLESYGAALTEALARSASDSEIDLMRREFGVSAEEHVGIVERMRSASGPLVDRARRELVEALVRRGQRETVAAAAAGEESLQLLGFLLARAEEASLGRVFELLGTVGDRARIAALRPALESRDLETRRRAFRDLAEASEEAGELIPLFERVVPEVGAPSAPAGTEGLRETLVELLNDTDPFVRAAAVWSLGATSPGAPELLGAARDDTDPPRDGGGRGLARPRRRRRPRRAGRPVPGADADFADAVPAGRTDLRRARAARPPRSGRAVARRGAERRRAAVRRGPAGFRRPLRHPRRRSGRGSGRRANRGARAGGGRGRVRLDRRYSPQRHGHPAERAAPGPPHPGGGVPGSTASAPERLAVALDHPDGAAARPREPGLPGGKLTLG